MVYIMESMDISEYYQTKNWSRRPIHPFDDELASKAEQCSSKWVNLYKNTSLDKDERNVCMAMRTIGLKSSVNKFIQPLPSQITTCDSLIEKDKVVLLHEKYFQFETSKELVAPSSSHEKDDLNIYSTVFDHYESIADDHKIVKKDKPKKPTATKTSATEKNQKTSKKKGRPKYRAFGDDGTDSVERTHLGAPPGVALSNSRLTKKVDLSKGNASIQFRL